MRSTLIKIASHGSSSEVLKALDEVGYEGWATAEVGGGGREVLQDVAERMDRVLGLGGGEGFLKRLVDSFGNRDSLVDRNSAIGQGFLQFREPCATHPSDTDS